MSRLSFKQLLILAFSFFPLCAWANSDLSPEAVNARIAPIAKYDTDTKAPSQAKQADTAETTKSLTSVAPSPTDTAPAASQAATTAKPVSEAEHLAIGKAIFEKTCSTCHIVGVSGAPKIGTPSDWAPRLAHGKAPLYDAVINGLNGMPPRGMTNDVSDDDLKAAVDYLLHESQ